MKYQKVEKVLTLARDQDYQAAQSFRWTSKFDKVRLQILFQDEWYSVLPFRTRDESAATTGTIVWKIGGFEKEILGKASLHEGVNIYISYIFNIKQ